MSYNVQNGEKVCKYDPKFSLSLSFSRQIRRPRWYKHQQNTVIRRIQFGAKNILCDSKDNNQLKDKMLNNNNNNDKHGVENIKKEVSWSQL